MRGMIKKSLIVGIVGMLLIISCSNNNNQQPSAKQQLLNQGIPAFTVDLLELTKDCTCQIDDQQRIFCLCTNKDWTDDVRFICKKPPVDKLDAVNNCNALKIPKK